MLRARDLLTLLRRLARGAWSSSARAADDRQVEALLPLQSELFSAEQMAAHGRELAASHLLGPAGARDRLLARLDDNLRVLLATCSLLTAALKDRQRIAPAGEWLLDNFYLIEEQIRTAKQHLPRTYSRELPRLATGPSQGLPRVYDLALAVISHGDGRVDVDTLSRFIAAYQSVSVLALGELWAIPIMLRLALIENLRRVGARITSSRLQLNAAQDWANRMMEVAASDPKSLILVIADMARSHPPLDGPFVAELARRLQGHGAALALPLTWIEQRLAESNQTIEELVLSESRQQAADQISISNSISGLRSLNALDWRVFVEAMSDVERILRAGGSGDYAAMDFATRDRYRHVVARIARRGHLAETAVASAAVELVRASEGIDGPAAHVGYYLVDKGLVQLEAALEVPAESMRTVLRRSLGRSLLALHVGTLLAISLLFCATLLGIAERAGVSGWALPGIAALALLAGSQLASAVINWLATVLSSPQRLPRMDYSRGLPPGMRSVVVVPTLINSVAEIDALLEALEVRLLGNLDDRLHFILLTDFRDAASETMPADAALLQHAHSGIDALNERHASPAGERCFLLHRPRRWNAADRVWMGYERKRGKLADLNAALRGDAGKRFSLIVGDIGVLADTRYVITLDTDTQLPRDCARQLVSVMAHPLNRPRYDAARQRVVAGYGILQPRMAASLSGANGSRYAQLFGSEPGIDPYTRSVSDVYQDLYAEGSFIGKGIYDLDAFERAMHGRFPENRILSHDLLEGCYARCGLLSDVVLYEDYPDRFEEDIARQRRWVRGDWQIAAWMMPWVPLAGGRRQANPLSQLSRWKIFDNLRRSLVAPAMLSLLLIGWLVLPEPGLWTLLVLGIVLLPPALAVLLDLWRKSSDVKLRQHLAAVARSLTQVTAQIGFRLACLPHEAATNLTAIVRSLWRMYVSRRRLLEWQVAGSGTPAGPQGVTFWRSYRRQWSAPLLALLLFALLLVRQPSALAAAAVLLGLWLAAPAISTWLSRPLLRRVARLSAAQTLFLRRIARKTWAFFDCHVVAADNWLPPDNLQEDPGPTLARRTSPTNIGISLLANLSAHDFGYISGGGLLRRTRDTFRTLHRLERYRGHFFNWYDTQTLQIMAPRYVSTVDSGNLAGHLLTLRAGLLALADQPLVAARLFAGLADTLAIVRDALIQADARNHPLSPPDQQALAQLQSLLDASCAQAPSDLADTRQCLQRLQDAAATLVAGVVVGSRAADWSESLLEQCRTALDDLDFMAPWLGLPDAQSGLSGCGGFASGDSLQLAAERSRECLQRLDLHLQGLRGAAERTGLLHLRDMLALGESRLRERIAEGRALATEAEDFASMEAGFLYDSDRHLLAIGYSVDDQRRDAGYYDLLASEARLANFVLIAQGQVPQDSWFALGRLLTNAGSGPVLVSWSGSMFEYLMPMLVMPSYAGSLLEQTCHAAVARQIAYGNQLGLPWGVSESGYNTVDASLNYQYHAFGVPGLGLQRGLAENQVVAPYASALALMVDPAAACANLQRLALAGAEGRFGFYEAVDYTAARLLRGQGSVIVRSFMAHHQGMSLLALAHHLLDRPMQRRFASDPQFQATLLLLQERVPKASKLRWRLNENADGGELFDNGSASVHAPIGVDTPNPEVQLLSNGRYHVMLTNTGAGYSRWQQLALTRWREDSTRDHWGSFIYVRDTESAEVWSVAHQPTLVPADSYDAVFSEGRAEYRRRDQDIETHTDIVVSPHDDVELRRVRITNRSSRRRSIELTSYAEVVLAAPAADAAQTAFGNLFMQTEIIAERRAIVCARRARSIDEPTPSLFHLLATSGSAKASVSFETDRLRFIGRGRTPASPQALSEAGALSGTAGSVLDPIVAIRCRVSLEAGESTLLDWVTGIADSREAVLQLIEKYQDRHFSDRVIELACTHSGVTLRWLNATEADAQLYRRLAAHVLYANATLRASAALLMQNRRGQSGLWGYSISGDLPIVLLKMTDARHIDLARSLIRCHAYWRLKGLVVDLVVWNKDHIGYRQQLQDEIMALVSTGSEAQTIDRPGGIFVRFAEQIAVEDRVLLQAAARVIISDQRGSLLEQVNHRPLAERRVMSLVPSSLPRDEPLRTANPSADLLQSNPFGGFSADGREYVISSSRARMTPLPWVNVLANARFGSVLGESGPAYTFGENAHEFRLTPWSDDPVGASSGEAFYLRDEESGNYWSPTLLPCGDGQPYLTRHGFGYSVYEHTGDGIQSELTVYVDTDEAVKFSVLRVRNVSGRRRRLSATGYVEWVLGDLRHKTAMHVVTEVDSESNLLIARNSYSSEFSGQVAFFDVDDVARTLSGDRSEFLGRNDSLQNPDALARSRLSGKTGAGLDPCGALQVAFELDDGSEREIIFRLGLGQDRQSARGLATRLRGAGSARAALQRVKAFWSATLGAIQVSTPDPALDLLANGWLLYQTLACRLWARSGYSQSGGAFGFRDQLQDTMALVHAQPKLLRQQLLLCASRQFEQGDVQHWWHPPAGRGVRTRCSDDYLWLPLAACRYVRSTGDRSVLDEPVRFLSARPLNPDEESYYDLPGASEEVATLYQHCVRAITHGLRFGERGLPLMGSGDWNDGMNLVGIHGRGESVWLGFFLIEVLRSFADLARGQSDADFAQRCEGEATTLGNNLATHAWDGDWYRRAWFDDGTVLGSSTSEECSIDSIAQSWSVLSGAATDDRARRAMESLDRRLVRREAGIIQLLDPPFDRSRLNPGYIKGYVPGVRENGGQYTHAAIWAAMAFARLGDHERAWELFALINPINHARSAADVARYKVEPYVVAADVYAIAPHTGRGGWTWYTGSAGWLYRLIIESLLGVQRDGDRLRIAPCLPRHWPSYTLDYRFGTTLYRIVVRRGTDHGATAVRLDDVGQADASILLRDDQRDHLVEVSLRPPPPALALAADAAPDVLD
jgi:cellobiose phosphorylase